jgi:hypothetical protein
MLFMWNAELTYLVTPKSGPMRSMRTLRDVNHAFLDDLTPQYRHRRHWFAVGRLLMAAASSKARLDVMLATDALVMALEIEGWMTRQPLKGKATICEIREIRAARALCENDQPRVPAALAA